MNLPIKAQRLYITKFDESMAETVHLNSLDDDNRRFVPDEVFETIDKAKEILTWLISSYSQNDSPLVYPVILNSGQNIGYVQAVPISNGWEVGYHIVKPFTSNGYATEAVKAFLPQVMLKLGIKEIYGICRADNAASRRVMEKCGFALEFDGISKYHGEDHHIRRYIYHYENSEESYMTTSTDISNRFWNLPQKADEETKREQTFIDDIIAKAHIERLLLENLDGIRTAFDGGAGYGRFSILLAKSGVRVTHFDISEGMIAKAKEIAEREGVADNITFVHGALEDLTAFRDRQFDMVMSFDAPISYTYPNHETAIKNLSRIASKRLVISVYSRLAWTYLFDPAQKSKYILDTNTSDPLARWTLDHALGQLADFKPDMAAVRDFFKTGLMEKTQDTETEYNKGKSPWPVSYSFMPDELTSIMQKAGAKNIRLSGPGALSRSIPGEVLRNIMRDDKLKLEFLDFCFWYDNQPWCLGMSKDNLVAIADI